MRSTLRLWVAAATGLFLIAGVGPFARADTRVVFTVDVESQALTLPKQIEAVCSDGSACGLMEIVRMLSERGIAGTFFLSVFEYRSWGEPAMRGITAKLQAAGQDVALHTHPQFAYDPSRVEMYQYSLAEQTAIVRDGVERLAAWTGRPVVAHRAGDYSADENTLLALKRNGILVDSSFFWGHPKVHLDKLGLHRNMPTEWAGVKEFPVTVFEQAERPHPFGSFFAPLSTLRKIDVNWLADEREAQAAIDAGVDAGTPVLVIFLHSFSLLRRGIDDGAPVADGHARDILRAILDRVAERHLPVVTMRDLADYPITTAPRPDSDRIPELAVQVGPIRYLWHRLRAVWAVSPGPVALLGCMTAVGALLGAFRLLRGRASVP